MSKQWLLLNEINGTPAAGVPGTSLVRIPTEEDIRLLEIHLELTNGAGQLMDAGHGEISIERNGRPQRFHTAKELDECNGIYGAQFGVSGDVPGGNPRLTVAMAEYYRQQYVQREIKAWDVQRGETVIVKVEHKNLAGTSPNVRAFALVEYGKDIVAQGGNWDTLRPVMTQLRDTFQVNSNVANINNIAKDVRPGSRLGLILFANPTGAIIDEAYIRWPGGEFRRTKLRNEYELARHGITVPDGYFAFVPDMTDNPFDQLPIGGSKLECELTFRDAPGGAAANGTGNVKIITQWEGARL